LAIKILYIDDNQLDRELVCDALERESTDFQLTLASSREEFESKLLTDTYDLVLSDFHIFGYEGFEILDIVNKHKPNIPVIIVTGTGSEEIAVQSMMRGAADYVIKTPRHIQHLPLTIKTVLEKKRLRDEQLKAEEALRQSEAKWRALAENAPDVILTIDRQGKILSINHTFTPTIKPEEIIGSPIYKFVDEEHHEKIRKIIENIFKTGEPNKYEATRTLPDGKILWYSTHLGPIKQDDKIIALTLISSDITDIKQAEEALRESELRFRTVAQTSVAAIFIYQNENFVYVNPAATTISGYSEEEFLKMKFWDIVHPDFKQIVKERGLARLRGETVSPRYEFKIITKNGEERWLDFGAGFIQYKGKPAAIGVAFDITERKKVEEKLNTSNQQLRKLMAKLHSIREEESTRIAREIHDELGQTLTGIKMDLSFLEDAVSNMGKSQECRKLLEKISSTTKLADNAIQTMRKITTELRPAILDSLGISAAVEWQAEEFKNRTGIRCEYYPPGEQIHLDRNSSIAIFRVLQESLTNIIRHAKANKVSITLAKNENMLQLEIKDNGIGISDSDIKKVNSFGILGMKERIWLLNGTFDIKGIPNKGTTVTVKIPLTNK